MELEQIITEKEVVKDIMDIFNPNKEFATYVEAREFLRKVSEADNVYIDKLDKIKELTKDIYSDV